MSACIAWLVCLSPALCGGAAPEPAVPAIAFEFLAPEAVLPDLKSPDPQVRLRAARQLANGRYAVPPVIRALTGALADQDAAVRSEVLATVSFLAEWGDFRDAVPALSRIIQGGLPLDRVRAAQAFAAMGTKRGEGLVKPLRESADPTVRGLIALALEEDSPDAGAAVPVVLRAMRGCGDDLFLHLHLLLNSEQAAKAVRPALLRAVQDKDPVVRKYALVQMGESSIEELVRLLPRAIEDPDEGVRCAALQAVLATQWVDDWPVAALFRGLEDTSARIRVRAAAAILCAARREESESKTYETLRAELANAFQSDLPELKDAASRGLLAAAANVRIPEGRHAVSVLLRALEQEDRDPLPQTHSTGWKFPSRVAGMLGSIGPDARPAVPVLLGRLADLDYPGSNDCRADPDGERVSATVHTLVRIGPTAVPDLLAGLKSDRPTIRMAAASALAYLHKETDKAVPVLIESLRGPCAGRCVYTHILRFDVCALAACGEPAVGPLLEAAKDDALRALATEALGMMGGDAEKVVPRLGRALTSENEAVRAAAACALGAMAEKAEPAIPALIAAADDRSPGVREAVC